MAGRNWLETFGRAKSLDVNADLDRGYEAALLIQSLELELGRFFLAVHSLFG